MGSSFKALASESPLLYLAWGVRGEDGAAAPWRGGWNYLVIEAGAATLTSASRQIRLTAPALVLVGPDCELTWEDTSTEPGKHLAWAWARPAHSTLGQLRRDAFSHYTLTVIDLAEFRQLHVSSRNEVHRGDIHSGTALTGLQFLLEARIARIVESGSGDRNNEVVDRALGWIQTHVATRQPLARLADFLGVSPATVQRLFRQQLGTTVMKSVAETRLREAERMLGHDGVSIKEIAYHLGYRHPHDFSRAFRNYTGQLPSRWEASAAHSSPAPRSRAARVAMLAGHS